jgi:hypothetical protein
VLVTISIQFLTGSKSYCVLLLQNQDYRSQSLKIYLVYSLSSFFAIRVFLVELKARKPQCLKIDERNGVKRKHLTKMEGQDK